MKRSLTFTIAILGIALLLIAPQSSVAQLDTSTTGVSKDTVNGWYYVDKDAGIVVDTAYQYLDRDDKVQGISSQGWRIKFKVPPLNSTMQGLTWEKKFTGLYTKPDSLAFFVHNPNGIANGWDVPYAFFVLIYRSGQQDTFWTGGIARNDWARGARIPYQYYCGCGDTSVLVKMQVHIFDPQAHGQNGLNLRFDSVCFVYNLDHYPYDSLVMVDPMEVPPHLALSSSSLDFGGVTLGCHTAQAITVFRADASPLDLHCKVTSTNPKFTVSPDSLYLATFSDSRTVTITFAPTDTGIQNGYIVLTHDGDNSPDTVVITGNGGAIPEGGVAVMPTVGPGWNIISNPVDTLTGACLPELSPRFSYNGRYVPETTAMIPGMAYWYKDDIKPLFVGRPLDHVTLDVRKGWGMIGSASIPLAVSDIVSDPPGITTSRFFGYNPATGYFPTDTLYPGFGYWVKVAQSGRLTAAKHHPSLAKAADLINVVDDGEQPPPPPGGFVSPTPEPRPKPTSYALSQNYPNPFNPSTTIKYALPSSGMVTLVVYNTLGQEVARLVHEEQAAGTYTVQWNATNVSSGLYFYQLRANEAVIATKKLTILK